ncbi:uncharacterized protein [Malus domestica]|uniref:uncharacterized protein n=1 Tax=Malus domestica TaxID=3750 RepID=UPI0039771BB6
MARNLENSTSENSNVQEMGLRRSVRLNATIRGAASSSRASTMGTTVVARGEVHGAFTTATMGTTAVATSVATRGEVHGAFTMARRSVRQNATIRGAASPPRVSTMGTTAVATSVATHGEVHGAFTTATMGTTAVATSVATRGEVHGAFITARAVPSKAHGTKTTIQAVPSKFTWTQAQASHSHAPRIEQPASVIQPAPVKQPTITAQPAPAEQPALVTQPAPDEQPTPVAQPAFVEQPTPVAQPVPTKQPTPMTQPAFVEQLTPVAQPAPAKQPALVTQPALDEQPTPVVQPASFEQPTTAQPAPVAFQATQVGPRLSQPSGPTIEPGAFSPHFFVDLTFPNSNLAPGVYHPSTAQGGAFLPSSSNPNGEQHLSRQVIELTSALAQQTTLVNQLLQRIGIQRAPDEVSRSRTRADGHFQQRPGKQPLDQPRAERLGSVHSRLRARRNVHSRLGPRRSIHSRLGSYSDSQHEQPSGQSVYSQLSPQGASSTSHQSRQHDGRREADTQSSSSSTSSLRRTRSPARNTPHALHLRHRRAKHMEEEPRPASHGWGQPRAPLPQQRQIQEEVERLLTKRLHDFQHNEVTDEALRRNMTNISRSPFTDEIEQAEPPREFSMPHFTSFKGDEDPERHLKRYRSAMILYRNNDELMCKIFATTLQGEAQDWFYTLPPQSIRNFYELSLVFTKEYSSYRSIKKKSDHLFNVKKNPKESLRDYVRRFKVEKAKIVGCNDSIARAAFQKGLPADHPLFGKLIMKEDLTLADSFALAEKYALWDEARQCTFKDLKKYPTSPP